MADTVRTVGQLLTLFADNGTGDISAQDGRDAIVSSFGWPSGVDPTTNNDNTDTAGLGEFFDTGSKWINLSSGHLWLCITGVHPAEWVRLLRDGDAVTSVGLTMPAEFAVANSPITDADTFVVTKATQAANKFWAGPTTGADAVPTFRTIVAADVPNLDASKITTGTLNAARLPAGGYGSGVALHSQAGGIAAAGTTQGTATLLAADNNEITSITPASAEGVKLPNAAGARIAVWNNTANTLKVWPPSGQAIHPGANDTSVNLTAGISAIYYQVRSDKWFTGGIT